MIETFVFKRSVNGFNFIKNTLVDTIKKSTSIYHDTNKERHQTDYHLSKDISRLYEPLVMPSILEHMRAFEQQYKFSGIELHHLWFQWYRSGDYHDWHVHPYCHFTNILYVSLPDKSLATQINGISVDVEEGDILTFPSFFLHQAPTVEDAEKIIISFNTNII
jgi:hypothetical protein